MYYRCCHVTDIGVGYLSTMTSLCRLYLRWCTLLRDFGLQHLYTMKNLTALSLAGNAPLYSAYTNPSPNPSMHDFPVCLFNPAFRGCQNPINGLLLLSSLFTARQRQRGICYRRVSVCPSVRPSQASIVSKLLDKSSLFWHGGFLPPIPHCAVRKCGYLQKLRYFLLGLCPQLRN